MLFNNMHYGNGNVKVKSPFQVHRKQQSWTDRKRDILISYDIQQQR